MANLSKIEDDGLRIDYTVDCKKLNTVIHFGYHLCDNVQRKFIYNRHTKEFSEARCKCCKFSKEEMLLWLHRKSVMGIYTCPTTRQIITLRKMECGVIRKYRSNADGVHELLPKAPLRVFIDKLPVVIQEKIKPAQMVLFIYGIPCTTDLEDDEPTTSDDDEATPGPSAEDDNVSVASDSEDDSSDVSTDDSSADSSEDEDDQEILMRMDKLHKKASAKVVEAGEKRYRPMLLDVCLKLLAGQLKQGFTVTELNHLCSLSPEQLRRDLKLCIDKYSSRENKEDERPDSAQSTATAIEIGYEKPVIKPVVHVATGFPLESDDEEIYEDEEEFEDEEEDGVSYVLFYEPTSTDVEPTCEQNDVSQSTEGESSDAVDDENDHEDEEEAETSYASSTESTSTAVEPTCEPKDVSQSSGEESTDAVDEDEAETSYSSTGESTSTAVEPTNGGAPIYRFEFPIDPPRTSDTVWYDNKAAYKARQLRGGMELDCGLMHPDYRVYFAVDPRTLKYLPTQRPDDDVDDVGEDDDGEDNAPNPTRDYAAQLSKEDGLLWFTPEMTATMNAEFKRVFGQPAMNEDGDDSDAESTATAVEPEFRLYSYEEVKDDPPTDDNDSNDDSDDDSDAVSTATSMEPADWDPSAPAIAWPKSFCFYDYWGIPRRQEEAEEAGEEGKAESDLDGQSTSTAVEPDASGQVDDLDPESSFDVKASSEVSDWDEDREIDSDTESTATAVEPEFRLYSYEEVKDDPPTDDDDDSDDDSVDESDAESTTNGWELRPAPWDPSAPAIAIWVNPREEAERAAEEWQDESDAESTATAVEPEFRLYSYEEVKDDPPTDDDDFDDDSDDDDSDAESTNGLELRRASWDPSAPAIAVWVNPREEAEREFKIYSYEEVKNDPPTDEDDSDAESTATALEPEAVEDDDIEFLEMEDFDGDDDGSPLNTSFEDHQRELYSGGQCSIA